MRIGIDARELCGQPTGVGRYLQGLLAEWSTADRARQHEFLLYAPTPTRLVEVERFRTRLVPGTAGTWWEQIQLPRAASEDQLDLFFSPGYTTPLSRALKRVVTIHDVSFSAHPEWFSAREGLRRRWLTKRSAVEAKAVITDSQFSCREIVSRLGVPEHKVSVIYPGVGALRHASCPGQEARVLYVGTIFARRHIPLLLDGFSRLARTHADTRLDIVGANRSHPPLDVQAAIAIAGLTDSVHWRTYVPEDDLAKLYGRARAFAFLSEYEGFGLTPLEALTAGIPPIVLDTEIARETYGDAALYVPPDHESVARALELVLYDEATRTRLLNAAPAVLSRYRWSRAADETLGIFERM